MCMFCRSLFVLLFFFFWPLCCLFFFDLRILIIPLVYSNYFLSHCCIRLLFILSLHCLSIFDLRLLFILLVYLAFLYYINTFDKIEKWSILLKLDVCLLYLFFFGNTLTYNHILYFVRSGFMLSTYQSAMSLLSFKLSKSSTLQELLLGWPIYLTVLHMIGWPNMNKRDRRDSDRMVVGAITTYAISTYHH
jgi:hypothetical protein